MSTLSASFGKSLSKRSQSEAFFSNQGDVAQKINDPICPVFQLVRGFIYVNLSCKFQEVPIKTE